MKDNKITQLKASGGIWTKKLWKNICSTTDLDDGQRFRENQHKPAGYYKTNHFLKWKLSLKILFVLCSWIYKQKKTNLKFFSSASLVQTTKSLSNVKQKTGVSQYSKELHLGLSVYNSYIGFRVWLVFTKEQRLIMKQNLMLCLKSLSNSKLMTIC